MKAACRVVFAVAIAAFACSSSVAWAQSPAIPSSTTIKPLVLYDDFNGSRIDPNKWNDWMATFGTLESVRELSPPYQGQGNNGRLHMFQRAYSWTGNDDGIEYGWIGLFFAKNPAAINELSFTVAVNGATATDCQSNPSASSSVWVGFVGRFFNYGAGQDDSQDVDTRITLTRVSADVGSPLTVTAGYGSGVASDERTLGFISLGQTAKLRVKWDQANHQFIFQLNNNPVVLVAYGNLAASPPVNPLKAFWEGRGVPHCTTNPTGSIMMDAYFDNVYVNAQ